MKFYAVDGSPSYKNANIVFKVDDNDEVLVSSVKNPQWTESDVFEIYRYQSSERWIQKITEDQANEIHEILMKGMSS